MDVQAQKQQILQKDYSDAFKIWEWIKGEKWEKKPYGPIFLEVNVPVPHHAQCLEYVVAKHWKTV